MRSGDSTVRDRELIALRYGADLSSAQIGVLLDLTTNAVDVALHRARERLRSTIEAEESVRIEAVRVVGMRQARKQGEEHKMIFRKRDE